jgi:outer membrane protein assembly factor BamD
VRFRPKVAIPILQTLFLIALTFNLNACTSTPKPEKSERQLYEDARNSLKYKNFANATQALEDLEAKFPFGKYAEQAQLDLIYARYGSLNLDGAIVAADRFIRLHPQSPNVDYAYYMKGLANYNLDLSLTSQYFPIDLSTRDPGAMRQAFSDFSQLTTLFPSSQYAPDAKQRMIAIRNRLAAYELHAARYYIRREALIAAANRAAYVVENYPETPSVEDALIMEVELYNHLKLKDEAKDALAVLTRNFPNGKGFDQDKKFKPQFLSKENRNLSNVMTFGVVK